MRSLSVAFAALLFVAACSSSSVLDPNGSDASSSGEDGSTAGHDDAASSVDARIDDARAPDATFDASRADADDDSSWHLRGREQTAPRSSWSRDLHGSATQEAG